MTEVINLNHKRKAKARSEKEKKASQNRVKFGRTKEEKNRETLHAERSRKLLEGHKLDSEEKE